MLPDELSFGVDAHVVPHLNALLRLELTAVETYRRAVAAFEEERHRSALQQNAENHQRRAERLRREVEVRGGTPADVASAWAYFEALTQAPGGPDEHRLLIALAEGESASLSDYIERLESLSGEIRRFVEEHLLPEQERTNHTLVKLRRRFH